MALCFRHRLLGRPSVVLNSVAGDDCAGPIRAMPHAKTPPGEFSISASTRVTVRRGTANP